MKFILLSLLITNLFGFNINIINSPFDRGANIKGSSKAFNALKSNLLNSKLIINEIININCDSKHITEVFQDIYINSWNNLNKDKISLQIGGDHSIAIPSIYAANTYCGSNRQTLGILWIDAHADFNTIETSPTGNLHGVPVAVLCGHTLPQLSLGDALDSHQFAYYGVRDIDSLEFYRIQKYNMLICESLNEIKEWIKNFDKIHISFDMDSLDPSIFSSVNTLVSNGLELNDIYLLFEELKKSKKLLSGDLVEYNPDKGINNKIIIDILEKMLL